MTPRVGTIEETAAALRAGTLTSVELTTGLLRRADALDPKLGTYLARFDEFAIEAAARADAEFSQGIDRGPLQGIPLGIKDLFATEEGPTSAQSLVLDPDWGARGDAPVVRRLRDQGAVIMGKTTTNEFAVGLPDPTKPFPIPRNPWDTALWAGGSSSGTANGISAGLFLGGLGTDTGGSVRYPSAACGITGLKPTFGRVPKAGCVPLGWTLDVVGPMARTARDCALLLTALAGHHPSDPQSAGVPAADYTGYLTGSVAGLRIGVEREHHTGLASIPRATVKCFESAVHQLEEAGAEVGEVTFRNYEQVREATWVVLLSEALAYHRRDLQERWGDYCASTRTALATAAFYSGSDYVQAQRVRTLARSEMAKTFEGYDVVLTPTVAGGAVAPDVDMGSLSESLFTFVWNAVGFPALSVPMGFDDDGLPLGLQIAGRPFEEELVLQVGDAFQQRTSWHEREPPLNPEVD